MHLDGCPYCMAIDFENQKSLTIYNSFCLDMKNNLDERPLEMIWMQPNSMKRQCKLKQIKRTEKIKNKKELKRKALI